MSSLPEPVSPWISTVEALALAARPSRDALGGHIARNDPLAGPGLAVDQHGRGARLGRALEPRQRVPEPVRVADDLQLPGRALAQAAPLEPQARVPERAGGG